MAAESNAIKSTHTPLPSGDGRERSADGSAFCFLLCCPSLPAVARPIARSRMEEWTGVCPYLSAYLQQNHHQDGTSCPSVSKQNKQEVRVELSNHFPLPDQPAHSIPPLFSSNKSVCWRLNFELFVDLCQVQLGSHGGRGTLSALKRPRGGS